MILCLIPISSRKLELELCAELLAQFAVIPLAPSPLIRTHDVVAGPTSNTTTGADTTTTAPTATTTTAAAAPVALTFPPRETKPDRITPLFATPDGKMKKLGRFFPRF